MNLPEWYCNSGPAATRQPGRNFARKALARIGETLARELSGSEISPSWLSHVEPRARVLGIVALIFAVTLLHQIASLAGVFIALVAVSASMRLPARRLARVWIGVPLFGLAIILPATLNVVTDGPTALALWREIAITQTGLVVAARFLLRSLDCITLSFLLIASTDPPTLVSALRRLGMPKVFGAVLAMMQRYMAVLLRTSEEVHLAKLSRTISASSVRHEQRWVASGIGVLFRRTHKLVEEVRLAMLSRGYDGDLQVRVSRRWSLPDVACVVVVAAVAAVTLLVDRRFI
ncbi:MAG: cobalt ECF transporter T component CbiQ [Armatimonadota bacterium]